jgi:hypothetical protein
MHKLIVPGTPMQAPAPHRADVPVQQPALHAVPVQLLQVGGCSGALPGGGLEAVAQVQPEASPALLHCHRRHTRRMRMPGRHLLASGWTGRLRCPAGSLVEGCQQGAGKAPAAHAGPRGQVLDLQGTAGGSRGDCLCSQADEQHHWRRHIESGLCSLWRSFVP